MFGEIARFLIDIVFTLLGVALLLRAWLYLVRVPPANPLSNAVFSATSWLVHPLRRVLPGTARIDWASLVAAWLAALASLVLTVLVSVGDPRGLFPLGLGLALLTVLRWALNLLIWLTLAQAVLSWVNPHAQVAPTLYRLTAPMLEPIRRRLPTLGGIDLSPLVLLVLAQIGLMVLGRAGFALATL